MAARRPLPRHLRALLATNPTAAAHIPDINDALFDDLASRLPHAHLVESTQRPIGHAFTIVASFAVDDDLDRNRNTVDVTLAFVAELVSRLVKGSAYINVLHRVVGAEFRVTWSLSMAKCDIQ